MWKKWEQKLKHESQLQPYCGSLAEAASWKKGAEQPQNPQLQQETLQD